MKRVNGFTLIELMIVVLIVALLAALAFSAYNKQVQKSRRAEAKQILADIGLRQEKWRSNNPVYYGTDSTAAETTAFGAIPTGAYYTIAVTTAEAAAAYTLTAAPKGPQLADSCGTLTWTYSAGVVSKTATSGTDCW
ncbi:MAG: type IV pilin protein [Pseudomonas sp.]|nr:type IV pilin protein [Pseudomonas sp.]